MAALGSVRRGKNCDLGFENAALGLPPQPAFSRPRSQFFPIRTSGRKITYLEYTTQVSNTFRARWLASSEMIGQILFTLEQPKNNKMAFLGIL